MDNAQLNLRGWDVALAGDDGLGPSRKESHARVIGKFLAAVERRGRGVSVETARDYIDAAEGMLEDGQRWEEGREALRWLVRYLQREAARGEAGEWRERMVRRLRERHYAERTVETYGGWVARYAGWCEARGESVETADGEVVRRFLDWLAADQQVRVATQHQALNAVAKFHEEVLGRKLEGAEGYLRARRADRVPVVLMAVPPHGAATLRAA